MDTITMLKDLQNGVCGITLDSGNQVSWYDIVSFINNRESSHHSKEDEESMLELFNTINPLMVNLINIDNIH